MQHTVCSINDASNFSDPWLYVELRASIDEVSLSNSFIVVTNRLDRFQLWLNATPCHWQFHHETFMAHSWDKESTKNRLRKSFFETKLISCADNSKVAFNVEIDVLLISALFSAAKLLLTEQLIGWAASSSILIVSVRILKLEENVIWTIAQRKLTYKP